MKWKPKEVELPEIGDVRRERVFLLFPRACTDGYTRWLCHAERVQVCEYFYSDVWVPSGIWITQEYVPLNVPLNT